MLAGEEDGVCRVAPISGAMISLLADLGESFALCVTSRIHLYTKHYLVLLQSLLLVAAALISIRVALRFRLGLD